MSHSYRSGKYPISNKVWRKLEAAEAAAGMELEKGFNVPRGTLKKGSDAESSGNPNDPEMGDQKKSSALHEDAATYRVPDQTEALLARIAAALEEIARKLPDSTT